MFRHSNRTPPPVALPHASSDGIAPESLASNRAGADRRPSGPRSATARWVALQIGILALVVGSTLCSSLARAEPSENPYNGASYGPELQFGYGRAVPSETAVGSLAVGFRHSFVFLLGDSRISYVLDGPAAPLSNPDRHGAWLHTCIHPLAPALLWSDWVAYFLASPYFEIGAGALFYPDGFAADVASPAFGWSVGGGLDIPLANPDRGQAPWLQILYRYRTDSSNLESAGGRARAHQVFAGLSWRFNGALF